MTRYHHIWGLFSLLFVFILLTVTACGTLEVDIEGTTEQDDRAFATDANQATRVVTPGPPIHTTTGSTPTPTSVLDGSHLSFSDPELGLSLDIPLWWEPQTTPGAVTRFYQQDSVGARQTVLTLSVLSPESDTLESAAQEVTQGDWGPYVRDVQPVTLGWFNALRVEFSSGPDRPPVIWLVVAPSGRAVGIMPEGDPAWIEPMIEVVLATLRPIASTKAETPRTTEEPMTRISTPTPILARSLSDLVEPLLIDGEKGWIFASARADGQPRTVKLATQDGRLLATYNVVGRLALDRTANRLFVDQGEAGVVILDAQTGAVQARVALPLAGPASADPQVDPASGLAYAFRDRTIYVIDPTAAAVIQAETLRIPSIVCDDPSEDALIARSFYDLVNNRLYVALVTRVCTPWVQQTIVAYDAATFAELGRYTTGSNYQAVPYSDSLYGTDAPPVGRNVAWAWNGREAWFEQGDEGRPLQGIVADWGRQLIYEGLGGQIRVFKAYPREVIAQVEMPLLGGGGRLAGHDPISDQLYFLVDGQLEVRPTTAALAGSSQTTEAPAPYCRPSEAFVDLSASATTVEVGQVVSVTVNLANGVSSGVRLGQIWYSLEAQPPGVLIADELGTVEHPLTIEPGQSDEAQFILQAAAPGRATLTASTSFEIHAIEDFAGSWSGCDSWPLEIVVTP